MLKAVRFLVPVLILSLLMSCTASQHAGVTTIGQPPITENNESAWFSYYRDQFDAYEGNVSPVDTQYPRAAHRAHQLAKKDRDSRELNALFATVGIVGLGIACAVVHYFVLNLSIEGTGK
jgi:hypothetical protein